ncbi:MAG: hypothetical protein IJY69_02080 [Clostridia bacterium]|nr:hypothetical protein [Clostridia bacterium]
MRCKSAATAIAVTLYSRRSVLALLQYSQVGMLIASRTVEASWANGEVGEGYGRVSFFVSAP